MLTLCSPTSRGMKEIPEEEKEEEEEEGKGEMYRDLQFGLSKKWKR